VARREGRRGTAAHGDAGSQRAAAALSSDRKPRPSIFFLIFYSISRAGRAVIHLSKSYFYERVKTQSAPKK